MAATVLHGLFTAAPPQATRGSGGGQGAAV